MHDKKVEEEVEAILEKVDNNSKYENVQIIQIGWIPGNNYSKYVYFYDSIDNINKYNNDLLSNRGYQPYKDFPKASPELQQFIDKYTASDTGTKKAMRNSDPQSYIAMSNYFDNMNLYEINKQGALSILQGQPDYTNKELKQISNLARDIVIQNGLSTLVPAAFMQGYGTSGKGKKMSSAMKFQRRKLNQMLKKATLKKISSGKIKKTNLSSVLSGSKFLTTPKTSKGANSSLSSLL